MDRMEVLRGSRARPERAPRGGQPRTCARTWRREGWGDFAAGDFGLGWPLGASGARGPDSLLLDLGRLPVVIICGLAWGPPVAPGPLGVVAPW